MGKINKKTHEEYIAEVMIEHQGYYSYPNTRYIRSKDTIIVTCPTHGDFPILAGKHRHGQGCKHCGIRKSADAQRDSLQTFIAKAYKHHKDTYDYSKVILIDDATKVEIICHNHGSFWQTPRAHKQGKGCSLCAKEQVRIRDSKSVEDYFPEWKERYNDKYDYSLVDKSAKGDVPIEIVCPDHGSFWRTAHRHNAGRGCAKCAVFGFNKGKSATFYILKCDEITKVGITNRDITERVNGINRSSGLSFDVHTTVFSEDGIKVAKLEKDTLCWLRENYQGIESKFDGYTECFMNVSMHDLLNFVMPISEL